VYRSGTPSERAEARHRAIATTTNKTHTIAAIRAMLSRFIQASEPEVAMESGDEPKSWPSRGVFGLVSQL
jgi:hypothetical protein